VDDAQHPDQDDDTSEDDGADAPSPADKARRERLAELLSIRRKLEPPEIAALRTVFPIIFRGHFYALWARLQRRGLGKEDAEDLVNRTFEDAFREICEEGFQGSMDARLNRIQKGRLLNLLRSRKRSPLSLGIPSSDPALAGPQPDFDRARDREDLEKRVRPLLSDKHWEVVELVLLNGLEPAEAAEILGIAEGTVHSRLSRAKEKLAKLAHRWVPPSKRKKLHGRAG
jgi:RNA polymerase sigma-70 factor (ECF subfamily)